METGRKVKLFLPLIVCFAILIFILFGCVNFIIPDPDDEDPGEDGYTVILESSIGTINSSMSFTLKASASHTNATTTTSVVYKFGDNYTVKYDTSPTIVYRHYGDGFYWATYDSNLELDGDINVISAGNYEIDIANFDRSPKIPTLTSQYNRISGTYKFVATSTRTEIEGLGFTSTTITLDAEKTSMTEVVKVFEGENSNVVVSTITYDYSDFAADANVTSAQKGLSEALESDLASACSELVYVPVTEITSNSELVLNINQSTTIECNILPSNASDTRVVFSLEGENVDNYVLLEDDKILAIAPIPADTEIRLIIKSKDNLAISKSIVIKTSLDVDFENANDSEPIKLYWSEDVAIVPYDLKLVGSDLPDATIEWVVGTQTLANATGATLQITSAFIKSYLSVGDNTIIAKITVKEETVQRSKVVKIQNQLATFTLETPPANETITIGDSVNIIAIISILGDAMYVPDKFHWILYRETESGEEKIEEKTIAVVKQNSSQSNDDGDMEYIKYTSTFAFTVDAKTNYYIDCQTVVYNMVLISTKQRFTIKSENIYEQPDEQSSIYRIYLDGGVESESDTGYDVIVKWNNTGLGDEYRFEMWTDVDEVSTNITTLLNPSGSVIVGTNYFTLSSDFLSTLDGDTIKFRVRVEDESSVWSDFVAYTSEFDDIDNEYFMDNDIGINNYIADIEEFGDLFNYLAIFRPDEYITDANIDFGERNGYELKLYIPFDYDDIANIFPADIQSVEDDGEDNARKLLFSMLNACAESIQISYAVNVSANNHHEITYYFAFADDLSSEDSMSTSGELPAEIPGVLHAKTSERLTLPVDEIEKTIEVATADQLYFALVNGYNPNCIQGSHASAIYTIVRTWLLENVSSSDSEADKIHKIYDYLTLTVTYEYPLLELIKEGQSQGLGNYTGFSAYGPLLLNKGVCDGIAKAFAILASMEGIASKKITGESHEQQHAWNAVLIGEFWYLVDATWGNFKITIDESEYEVQTHNYLLRSASDFSQDHQAQSVVPPISDTRYTLEFDYSYQTNDLVIKYEIDQSEIDKVSGYILSSIENADDFSKLAIEFEVGVEFRDQINTAVSNALRNSDYELRIYFTDELVIYIISTED
ncbi:MAG: hypothetical protein LBE09_01550 [Christensenellaceae bacterium]|jgi:hypothetical protein|nr:hypothetical protein [Christensenellaceae bacterium]